MSAGKVDVLAVLQAVEWTLGDLGRDTTEFSDARIAVAELIEAAGVAHQEFVALIKLHGEHSCYEIRDRMTAALARVQP